MSRYDWDDAKARTNLAKHGVSFEKASDAIGHPLAVEEPDTSSGDDDRLRITCWTEEGRLLVVVLSIARPRPRIISARRATKRERHAYETRP